MRRLAKSLRSLVSGAVLIAVLLSACGGESGTDIRDGSSRGQEAGGDVALRFASAWLEGDFPAAQQLQCPGVPEIDREIDSVRLDDFRIEGAPTAGPYGGGVLQVENPRIDFHVLFSASESGEPRRGAVEVELGKRDKEPCVLAYGRSMDLPVEG